MTQAALDAQRFLLGVATWAAETTDPNAGAGTPGAVGSLWQRGNAAPNPTEIFFKTAANDKGWTKENLINLKVFNVQKFGAVGDGAHDDTLNIRAAYTAAGAAGGGIVYFPPLAPGKSYRVTKPSKTDIGSLNIQAASSNITFMGDGYASYISMIGDSGGQDWFLMWIHNGAKRIRVLNLRMDDAGVTNQAASDQNHLINVFSFANEHSNDDVDVIGCFFTQKIGDATRFGGDAGGSINNGRVAYNCYDMNNARSAVGVQRFTTRCQVSFNWAQGCSDQTIDFEPTAGIGTQVGPVAWIVRCNMILHSAPGPLAFSLAGAGHQGTPGASNIYANIAYNVIDNGQIGIALGIAFLTIRGNVLTLDSTLQTGDESMLFVEAYADRTVIDSNILACNTASGGRTALRIVFGETTAPRRNSATNNLCKTLQASAINCSDNLGVHIGGNLCYVSTTVASVSAGVTCSAGNVDVDNVMVEGNLCVATNQKFVAGVQFGANGHNLLNNAANYNYVVNALRLVFWTSAGPETFTRWRNASHNFGDTLTSALITPPPTNVGATIEGSAGPGCQGVVITNASGPEGNVTAPVGSFAVDPGGTPNGVLWTKESGSGVGGGATGWVQQGAAELNLGCANTTTATAARFLAPGGMGLANASATEIKTPMTRPGTVRNLRLHCTAGAGTGANTYTLRKNGADTSVTFSLANNTTTGSDTTHTFNVVAGDLVSESVAKAATPASGQTNVITTYELV